MMEPKLKQYPFGYEMIALVSSLTSDFELQIAEPFSNGKIVKKKISQTRDTFS